ncbi:MAG: type II secretion system F family protein [Acidobacteriota bacterium]|nr:type II secretion system F family protein [Acidobacteriota bacterium]
MAEFFCRLADPSGRVVNASYNSVSESELRRRLEDQGFFVYSVREKGKSLSTLLPLSAGRRKIKSREFVIFNQQFLALIQAGLPILKSLELLTQREKDEQFRTILLDISDRVKGGALLSEAFEAQGMFPRVYTASLFAGEKSGGLEEVLARFIQYQKTVNATRNKIKTALTYPSILAVLLVVLVSFLLAEVVPRFAQFYAGMDAALPAMTVLLVDISQAIRGHLIAGMLVSGVLLVVLTMWARSIQGRSHIDRLKLKLPVIGEVWSKFLFAQLSRTLSTLLSGGTPLVGSLEIVADSTGNRVVTQAINRAVVAVREGQSLSRSLEPSGVVPEVAIEMIEVGESSGNLSEMLGHVADFYDEEVNTRLNQLFTYIEPILLMILAIIVAFVLIALYLPIFSLSSRLVA